MAAGYLRAVREVQPTGPYTLGGWSLGGVVAFEMARQLERRGESVDLLVLIDSRAPGAGERPAPRTDGELVAQFAYDLARIFGLGLSALPAGFADLTAAEALDRLAIEAAHSGALPPGLDAGELARRFAVFAANFRAFESYRGGRCEAPLILFRAGDAQDSETPADLGWERLLGRPAEAFPIPGDHYTLLQPPHVEELATRLRQALRALSLERLSEAITSSS
jgi:thioesterase domain-containing protein